MKIMRHLFACIACLLYCLPAMGREIHIPLRDISSNPIMTLKCIGDEQGISIPIADRWDVKKVTLNLHYVSSINLIGDISQLVIKINGAAIAQTKLNPMTPDRMFKVDVPVQYLKAGYNSLDFQVAQHFMTRECERPCSPDLWTSINMNDSYIDVEYESNPVPLKLSAIAEFLFDPKTYPDAHVNIITEDQSAENLTIAAIVSSGISRRYDYRKVIFSVSQQIKPGMDNVVVGRRAFMQEFLAPFSLVLGSMEGGYLKIFPLPVEGGHEGTHEIFPLPAVDGSNGVREVFPLPAKGSYDVTHALLAVSGETFDHVKIAAETMANISFAYPGSQELNAFEFEMPKVTEYGGRAVILADKTYDFKTLDFPTTTFQGINAGPRKLSFRLPADFLIQQNLTAKLVLNFAYGAGMREDSAMNVIVNGKAVRAVGLNKKSGDFLQNYGIDIPAYLFKPGSNVISFGMELHPDLKECDLALMGNLFLTMFENSTLTFPDMPHFVEMPRLELFMLNGFPFTRWPDGYESMIYLTDVSAESMSAAMNMVGLITQKIGFPLLGIQIGLASPKNWKGDLIVIGSPKLLPPELKEKSPLRTSKTSWVPYPVIQGWEGESSLSFSRQISSLGEGRGLLMQFESPYFTGRTAMVLVADNNRDLLHLSEAMLDPVVQGGIIGDLVLIEMTQPKPKVTSLQVAAKYITGKGGDMSAMKSFLNTHIYVYYILLGVLILGFTYTIYVLLKRYRATRKLGQAQNEE